jgi:hypothetical protein
VIKDICDVVAKITPRLDFRVMPPILIRNNETCARRQMAQLHSDGQQISVNIFQATGRVSSPNCATWLRLISLLVPPCLRHPRCPVACHSHGIADEMKRSKGDHSI